MYNGTMLKTYKHYLYICNSPKQFQTNAWNADFTKKGKSHVLFLPLLLHIFLSAANVYSTELRFEFKLKNNLATATQTEGFGLKF